MVWVISTCWLSFVSHGVNVLGSFQDETYQKRDIVTPEFYHHTASYDYESPRKILDIKEKRLLVHFVNK